MHPIALHSVPRSGSSWLGQLFNSSPKVVFKFQPLFSYAFKDYLDETASRSRIEAFFEAIAHTKDDFLDQRQQIESGNYPKFEDKTQPDFIVYKEVRYHHILENLMLQMPQLKVIGLVRHPAAVINSWLRAPREFRVDLGWDPLVEWRYAPKKNQDRKEEYFGFEKWKEVANMFLHFKQAFPEQFYLCHYLDLLEKPKLIVEEMFDFCRIPIENQTLQFLIDSTQKRGNSSYAVYRSNRKDDNWKTQLPDSIQESILSDIENSPLEQFLK